MVVILFLQQARAWIDSETGSLAIVFIARTKGAEGGGDFRPLAFAGFIAVVIFAAGFFHDASGKNGQQ